MAVYKLSSKADADLAGIYEYTILNFGLEQGEGVSSGLTRALRRACRTSDTGTQRAGIGAKLAAV